MIHIGLPPPMLSRLRLHWHVTRSHFERQSQAVRQYVVRTGETTQAWWRQTVAQITAAVSLRARAQMRQLTRLTAFETCYYDMVDVICWAAKEGSDPRQDERYAKLRIALRLQYRPLRKAMQRHWFDAQDPDTSDPFEALFLPDDLDIVINAAMGIETMMKTQCAIEQYRTELHSRLPQRLR